MSDSIKHEGIVELVEPSHLKVRILQASACSACGAKGLCKSADSKEKLVDVFAPNAESYRVGDSVEIEGRVSMGMKAVRIAFVLPLVMILAAFVLCYWLSKGNELLSGLIALIALVPYGVGLWLSRNRLEKEFVFQTVRPVE